MSDAELRDMGLYRGDIVRVAYGQAEASSPQTAPANRNIGRGTQTSPQGGFGMLSGSH